MEVLFEAGNVFVEKLFVDCEDLGLVTDDDFDLARTESYWSAKD